ncbi:MAG: 3-ketoacyl-ACP reductase [Rhizobiaceae bacterium]|jgi:NAD(P)-dependent dehydrogenase (short-subunit alcohol dehydrogenase family)|nr:3-ketoacyl-ACP reductase [Rhizobiaceae bacterium]
MSSAPLALITGGQQGIGLGIALALAGAGFRIVAVAEHEEESPVVQAARAALPGIAYHRHDLRQVGAVEALLDQVSAAHGPVTAFVSNAGVPARIRGDMLDVTPENFDFAFDINLRGAFFFAQSVTRRMLGEASPHYRSLTFITSVSAEMVSVERAEYCMSKSAASMMAQLFAVRLAAHGIGVFEMRPGIIETAMTAGVKDRYDARIADGLVPAQRWGTPADIGSVIVPLATGQAAFATGAVIPVDGGLSISRL